MAKHQWIAVSDTPGRTLVELWVLGIKKYRDGETGMYRHFTIEDELARVTLVSAQKTKWKWEAAGKSGPSFSEEAAKGDAERALQSAGIDF